MVLRSLIAPSLIVALAATAGCPPPKPASPETTRVTASGEPPAFPGDFTPPPPLTAPPAPDPKAFGLSYLELAYPGVRDSWNAFLEDCRLRLPPSHPLNNATLEATVAVVVDAQGKVVSTELVRPSGNADFDAAAREIAEDLGPLPPPPRELLSDDDQAYLTWLFARDQRQAGLATAKLSRVEWSIDRAVPKFITDGELAEAARRLARAAAAMPATGPEAEQINNLATRLLGAVIQEGLLSPDPAVQKLAVDAAAGARLGTSARELRAIADGSADLALRAAALAALGTLGDDSAAPSLIAALERDQGANADVSGEAGAALTALGKGEAAVAVVNRWLASGKKEQVWGGLVALARFPAPSLVPRLIGLAASPEVRIRAAACAALGSSASKSQAAMKPLIAGVADADATVRAACARGMATAAIAGAHSRAAFWAVVERLKDRDERVRAAAVLASAHLEPTRVSRELPVLGRERSPVVLVALARGLAAIPGPPSRQLLELAGAGQPSPVVREAAVAALATRGDAGSRAVAAAAASDPEAKVRLAAVAALIEIGALTALAGDESPDVRVAAQARLIAVKGRAASLLDVVTAVAEAPKASAERVRVAGAWLLAR